jgi:hypothetical protein
MKKRIRKVTEDRWDEGLTERSVYLEALAGKAFNEKHYHESAVIYFQTLEFSLRLVVHFLGLRAGLSKSALERMEIERSFYHLILYFDLLDPGNSLSERLLKFINQRNDLIHKLYFSETNKLLEAYLIDFCLEAKDLIQNLIKEIAPRKEA